MIVILTEKPSAARNFAKAFGGMEGTTGGENYKIVHASGHLYGFPKEIHTLVDESKQEMYRTWDLKYLPWDPDDIHWRMEKVKGEYPSKCITQIRGALKGATEVCIGTDNDPSGEGDLLGWEILIALGWKGTTSRMRFEDESEKSLRKAFKEREYITSPLKSGEFIKANARTKFDYISMQLTRMSSLLANERGHRVLIRQGRLKSVMTYLIGHQLELIKNYKRVPFYEARYKDENGNVYKRKESEDIRFPKAEDVDLTEFVPSDVVIDSKEQKTSAPATLIDLAGLGTILGGKGYNTDSVLSVYQKMYEDGIVSYPRTEDKQMTLEQFVELKRNAPEIAKVVNVSLSLLTHLEPRKKHLTKDAAHGPNRPGSKIPKSLSEVHDKYGAIGEEIYRTLALNSLAIFAEDYVYEHQEGHIKNFPQFRGSVNIPVSQGYKVIFDDDEKEEKVMPLGTRAESFVYEGANPKPKNPTMKWLIGKGGQLEKYSVGTGATRLSTFNDVKNGKDASKQLVKMAKNGSLSLTTTGELSYHLLHGTYIGSPKVTERLFENMEAVGKFEKDPREIIDSIKILAEHDFEAMKKNAGTLPEGTARPLRKEKAKGVFAPLGEEIEFNAEWGGHRFTDDEIEKLLQGEMITIEAVSKTGEKYKVKGSLGKGEYKKKTFWGFQKTDEMPDEWCGHIFTEEEKAQLLDGNGITRSDFVSKKKKTTFTCTLYYRDGKFDVEFANSIPDQWCRHVFTQQEKEALQSGGKVIASDFVSKKSGKMFTAELTYEDGKIKASFA